MSWDYKISERALKQFQKLDPQIRRRIIHFLDARIYGTEDPRRLGKQLKGELNNIWRFRVGDYRVLCQLQDEIFVVLEVHVAHRQDVYE